MLVVQQMKPQLMHTEASNPLEWLDVVWSLVLLNIASEQQVSSVLNEDFVNSVIGGN